MYLRYIHWHILKFQHTEQRTIHIPILNSMSVCQYVLTLEYHTSLLHYFDTCRGPIDSKILITLLSKVKLSYVLSFLKPHFRISPLTQCWFPVVLYVTTPRMNLQSGYYSTLVYSGCHWKVYECCFMKQNCHFHRGLLQYKNATMPLNSLCTHSTH